LCVVVGWDVRYDWQLGLWGDGGLVVVAQFLVHNVGNKLGLAEDVVIVDICPPDVADVGAVAGAVLFFYGSGVQLKLFIRYNIWLESLEGGKSGGVGWEAELGFTLVLKDFPVYHVSCLFFKLLRYLDKGVHHFVGFRQKVAFYDCARMPAPRGGERAGALVRGVASCVRRGGLCCVGWDGIGHRL
jgi:hypothetical protein